MLNFLTVQISNVRNNIIYELFGGKDQLTSWLGRDNKWQKFLKGKSIKSCNRQPDIEEQTSHSAAP